MSPKICIAKLGQEAIEPSARDKLFPDNPEMPPGCSIKGKFAVRAKVTGYRGIYHLEGCRSYRTLKNPNRWFCSEEDAQAAGSEERLRADEHAQVERGSGIARTPPYTTRTTNPATQTSTA